MLHKLSRHIRLCHWQPGVIFRRRRTSRPAQCVVPKVAPATPVVHTVVQLTLLDGGGKVRRPRVKRKKVHIKGKQYALRVKFRTTPRKIAFRLHAGAESAGNQESWSDEEIVHLHSEVLWDALMSIKELLERKSTQIAAILAWMDRKGDEEPFAFEKCCQVFSKCVEGEWLGEQDPDVVRYQTHAQVRAVFGAELPHYDLLRQGVFDAEAGDPDAVAWVRDEAKADLSFAACCEALGFDPARARHEIRIPTQTALIAA